jgi:preprotein translocase subunit SecD
MRRNVVYLVTTLVLVTAGVLATIVTKSTPILGLDLRGGISVVLEPQGHPTSASVNQAVEIIRNRVDSLGVAEPEISRQGPFIVIDLPGVKNRAKAQRIVGRTAELRFRPVLAQLPPYISDIPTTTTTKAKPKSKPKATTTTKAATTTSTGTASASGAPATTPTTAKAGATGSTTKPTTSAAPKLTPEQSKAVQAVIASCDPAQMAKVPAQSQILIPTTKIEDDKRDGCVVLPTLNQGKSSGPTPRLFLGKTVMTGKDTSGASAQFQTPDWSVVLNLKSSGHTKFNALAAASFPKTAPQNSVAIVLDGVVQSYPKFNTASFPGDVSITGSFTQGEAKDLARLLQYGALPVQLKQQAGENVSPTLGSDNLRDGIIAGIVGLALVALYMLLYYRLLGLVVIVGLGVSGAATWAIITGLSHSAFSLTLTLAGVTGLIVSVGITVDSYVVYFERLKDEVRGGKTVRSSVDRGFTRSFRTIVAADLVSLIGAGTLYALAVGSVKGFAFFLGLSTLLDLIISYFFMHPLVSLMARRPALVRARGFGMASGLDVKDATR